VGKRDVATAAAVEGVVGVAGIAAVAEERWWERGSLESIAKEVGCVIRVASIPDR
jgi:hypothetical protein